MARAYGADEDLLDDAEETSQNTADDAVAAAEREGTEAFLRGLEDNVRRQFLDIRDAWARLDAGTYGLCERCGQPIDRRRLELVPYATTHTVCPATEEDRSADS